MTPAELKPDNFYAYPQQSRDFAVQHLDLLRRLPVAVCPSFLLQIKNIPTSFPFETHSLYLQVDALQTMSASAFNAVTENLRGVKLPDQLLRSPWVDDPAAFITAMTAELWSSGQIDRFRDGTRLLFDSLPEQQSAQTRLVIVVIGQGAQPAESDFGKLRQQGLLVQSLADPDIPHSLLLALQQRAASNPQPYAHWYIDGGTLWNAPADKSLTQTSFASLSPLRERVLRHIKNTIFSGDAGTEVLQKELSGLSPKELDAGDIVDDPVLQRFYTELFTLSSGPQIFSTSFVQWAGRELMRRAQPSSVLLRYAPRQRHRSFDEMVVQSQTAPALDPLGSLRDAEMGAYYALLEARRITTPAALTFLTWLEGTSRMLVVAPGAPAGTETMNSLTVKQILQKFS